MDKLFRILFNFPGFPGADRVAPSDGLRGRHLGGERQGGGGLPGARQNIRQKVKNRLLLPLHSLACDDLAIPFSNSTLCYMCFLIDKRTLSYTV